MAQIKLQKSILSFFIMLLAVGFSFSLSVSTAKAQFGLTASEPDQYVQVRIIADNTQVTGGETIRLGLEQTIYPGWHTYWINPGDSGTATSIKWDLPAGFEASELEWPTPEKIPFGPLTNYGYEGQVVLLQDLTLPENIGTEPFALNGSVDLLVCYDICIPESHDVFITFNGMETSDAAKITAAENALPLAVDWASNFKAVGDELVITTTLNDISLLQDAQDVKINPENWGAIDNNAAASLYLSDAGFELRQKLGARDLAELENLPLVISYVDAVGDKKAFRMTATPAAPDIITSQASGHDITIFTAILFALFGGMILNLMPCVFPVLSMKALSLINLKGKEESKARGYGLSYTAGILISFALIGGTLLALKSGGAQIGWGFQLQNPVVILSLIYLVFMIGLNLFGFFEFSGRLGKLGTITQKLSDKSGHRGAFFTGVLATLVATPCTAPFMGAALGFALTQPAYVSMIVFLALGLGLAIPYLALCFIPALRSKLPRPGAWMETFRQFLAFPMFLTAVLLVWILEKQAGSLGVLSALGGIVFIAFALWLVRVMPQVGVGRVLSIIMIVFSLFVVATTLVSSKTFELVRTSGTQLSNTQNWSNFTPEKLDVLLAGNDPVFTNMTAAWCGTCIVNEIIALNTSSTKKLFANRKIQYLKGDWTRRNVEITKYLNSFDRQGVPLYVYYGPRDDQTGKRPEPIVLPQLLTAGLVEETISR